MVKPRDTSCTNINMSEIVGDVMSSLKKGFKIYTLSWWEKNWMNDEGKIITTWRQRKKIVEWDGEGDADALVMNTILPQERKGREDIKLNQVCLELGDLGLNTTPQTELEVAQAHAYNRKYFEKIGGSEAMINNPMYREPASFYKIPTHGELKISLGVVMTPTLCRFNLMFPNYFSHAPTLTVIFGQANSFSKAFYIKECGKESKEISANHIQIRSLTKSGLDFEVGASSGLTPGKHAWFMSRSPEYFLNFSNNIS